jgi:hypothetical protein
MRSRRLLAAACGVMLIAAVSCTGHNTKVLGTTKSTSSGNPAPRSSTAPKGPPGVPKVMLQSGTSYQNGALVQFCTGSSCLHGTGKQAHPLTAADPLLFIIDRIPATAKIQMTRPGASTVADARSLHVGSLMVFAPTGLTGAYVVRLDATWQNGNGSWVFSISIPRT